MVDEFGDILGKDKQRLDSTVEQLGTIDTSTYFEVPQDVVLANMANIQVDRTIIVGSSLIWGNVSYGTWGSFEWNNRSGAGFVPERILESKLFFDIEEDFTSTTYEDASLTTASGWGTGRLLFGLGGNIDLNPSNGASETSVVTGSFIRNWQDISNVFDYGNGSSFATVDGTMSTFGDIRTETAQIIYDGSLQGNNLATKSGLTNEQYPSSYSTYGGSENNFGNSIVGSTVNGSDFGIAFRYYSFGYMTDYLFVNDFGFDIPGSVDIDGIKAEIAHSKYEVSSNNWRPRVANVRMTVYGSFTNAGSVIQTVNLGSDVQLNNTKFTRMSYVPTGSFVNLLNGSFSSNNGSDWFGANPNEEIVIPTSSAGSEIIFRAEDSIGSVELNKIIFKIKQDDF